MAGFSFLEAAVRQGYGMTASETDRSLFAQPQVTAVLAGDADKSVVHGWNSASRNPPSINRRGKSSGSFNYAGKWP